jgi:hypothetical protein
MFGKKVPRYIFKKLRFKLVCNRFAAAQATVLCADRFLTARSVVDQGLRYPTDLIWLFVGEISGRNWRLGPCANTKPSTSCPLFETIQVN